MRRLLTLLTAAIPGLLVPFVAAAYEIDSTWSSTICSLMPCSGVGQGATGLRDYLLDKGVASLQVIFVALAAFMLFTGARWMVMFAEQEDMVKQGRMTFVYTIIGAAVVSIAQWVASAFSPGGTGDGLVNTDPFNDSFHNVLAFIRALLSVMLVVNIVIQAVRLITSQGEQDQVDKARKRLIQGFVGVGIVMLANVIATSVNPQAGSSNDLAREIAGIANYLLTILGFMSVIVVILAGVFLVFSVNDALKEKAKTIIKTAVVALVAVVVSYALVTTVINFS